MIYGRKLKKQEFADAALNNFLYFNKIQLGSFLISCFFNDSK